MFILEMGMGSSGVLHAQTAHFNTANRTNKMEKLIQELGLDPKMSSQDDIERAGNILREKGFEGILLIAPPKIDVDSGGGLPLLGFDAHGTNDRDGMGFDYSAVLVATELGGGETMANSLRRVHEDARPPKSGIRQPPGRVMGRFSSNARERLPEIPWKPGAVSLVVLLFDQRSNQARVTLASDHVDDDAPGQGANARVMPVFPPLNGEKPSGADYPSYSKNDGSPPVPAQFAINMSVNPEFRHEADGKCALRGSFFLPVAPGNVVPRDASGKPAVDVGDPAARAVIPIALVIMGNQMPGAFVIRLKVPVYGAFEATAGAEAAAGHFNIDLNAMEDMPKSSQMYTIWAFSGEVIGGAVKVNFAPN